MKNKLVLSNSIELVINTYKMYADINYQYPKFKVDGSVGISPVSRGNAETRKLLMVGAIANGDKTFMRAHGREPIGFVIQCLWGDGERYGASIKSHLDKWDRKRGLKVAYQDLVSQISWLEIEKEDRAKIAEIIGLLD